MHNKPSKPIRSKHHPLHLKLWWYYRDDAHVIHSDGPEDLNNLQNSMNQMHPTLKFTHETSKKPNQLSWLNYFQKKTLPWNWHTFTQNSVGLHETGMLQTPTVRKISTTKIKKKSKSKDFSQRLLTRGSNWNTQHIKCHWPTEPNWFTKLPKGRTNQGSTARLLNDVYSVRKKPQKYVKQAVNKTTKYSAFLIKGTNHINTTNEHTHVKNGQTTTRLVTSPLCLI